MAGIGLQDEAASSLIKAGSGIITELITISEAAALTPEQTKIAGKLRKIIEINLSENLVEITNGQNTTHDLIC
jgi:hypothetical protein